MRIIQAGNDVAYIDQFLSKGVELNLHLSSFESPLAAACRMGRKDVIELLLSRGADPNIGDRFSTNPLFQAAARGSAASMRLLLENGASLDTEVRGDRVGSWALRKAVGEGHIDVVRLLLSRGEKAFQIRNNVWQESSGAALDIWSVTERRCLEGIKNRIRVS